jgi:hypothetical protein
VAPEISASEFLSSGGHEHSCTPRGVRVPSRRIRSYGARQARSAGIPWSKITASRKANGFSTISALPPQASHMRGTQGAEGAQRDRRGRGNQNRRRTKEHSVALAARAGHEYGTSAPLVPRGRYCGQPKCHAAAVAVTAVACYLSRFEDARSHVGFPTCLVGAHGGRYGFRGWPDIPVPRGRAASSAADFRISGPRPGSM